MITCFSFSDADPFTSWKKCAYHFGHLDVNPYMRRMELFESGHSFDTVLNLAERQFLLASPYRISFSFSRGWFKNKGDATNLLGKEASEDIPTDRVVLGDQDGHVRRRLLGIFSQEFLSRRGLQWRRNRR